MWRCSQVLLTKRVPWQSPTVMPRITLRRKRYPHDMTARSFDLGTTLPGWAFEPITRADGSPTDSQERMSVTPKGRSSAVRRTTSPLAPEAPLR